MSVGKILRVVKCFILSVRDGLEFRKKVINNWWLVLSYEMCGWYDVCIVRMVLFEWVSVVVVEVWIM